MKRNTHQKQSILDVLTALNGQHPTTEMVYEHVSKIIPSISRATVYRILKQFAEQGIIAQIHIPESADHYDDFLSPHQHLLCDSCKSLVDLVAPGFPEIQLPQRDASGCEITGVEVIFRGICSKCAINQ